MLPPDRLISEERREDMKNGFYRIITVTVMIAIIAASFVTPMKASADVVEIITDIPTVDSYRYVLSTEKIRAVTSYRTRKNIATWVNQSRYEAVQNRTYQLSNKWSLNLGKNGQRSYCEGLPANFGSSVSRYTYSVTVKPGFRVTFYAWNMVFDGEWRHTRQLQCRKANEKEWKNSGPPEISYSHATGSWWTFGYEQRK